MKTTVYSPIEVYDHLPREAARRPAATNAIAALIARAIAGWKAARADRGTRAMLAELDAHLLRDIGIGDDEIPRIRAGEQFTPRAWRNQIDSR